MNSSPSIIDTVPIQNNETSSQSTRNSLLSLSSATSPTLTSHAQLIEQCRGVVEATKILETSLVSGADKRERLMIEELRFQAHALCLPSQSLLLHLSKDYQNASPSFQKEWNRLQELSGILLSDCRELLHLTDTTTLKGRMFSGDHWTKHFKLKPSGPSKAVPSTMWARKDLERIKDLVCYRLAIYCLPTLNLYLAQAFTDLSLYRVQVSTERLRLARESLISLKNQVRHCIYHPQIFQTIEVPQEQDWQSWDDSPNRYLNFIHFTKLAYRIFGMDWFTNKSDANAGNGSGPGRDSRDDSPVHLTAPASPSTAANTQPFDAIAPPQSFSPSKSSGDSTDPNVMRKELGGAVTGIESGGSGTGAPDEDPNHFSHATEISSGSATTGSDNSTFDLGQRIQSLLQQQLIQDQKEKEMLQKRVLQLEERCKVAELKAENEKERMEKVAQEAEQTQQKWAADQLLLEQQLEHYQKENQNLKECAEELDSQMVQLGEKHKEEIERRELKMFRLEEKLEKANKKRDLDMRDAYDKIKAMDQYINDLRDEHEDRLQLQMRDADDHIKHLKEEYESQLSSAHQKARTHADELKLSREQMRHVQEITKLWKLEDG